MSESLSLVESPQQPVTTMEPGSAEGDIMVWSSGAWTITQLTGVADNLVLTDAITKYLVNPDSRMVNWTNVYSTIQSAIDDAETDIGSDVTYKQPLILIAPGNYTENIVISKKLHLKGINSGTGSPAASVKIKVLTAPCYVRAGCTIDGITFERDDNSGTALSTIYLDNNGLIATDIDTDNPNTTLNIVNCTFNGLNSSSSAPVISLATTQANSVSVYIHKCSSVGTGNLITIGGANTVNISNCANLNGRISISSNSLNACVIQTSTLTGDIHILSGITIATALQLLHIINSRIITNGNLSSIRVNSAKSNMRLENVSFFNSSNVGTQSLINIATTGSILYYANLIFNSNSTGGGGSTANDIINSNGTGSAPIAIDTVPTITP